jgi:hypothetical protein
MTVITVTDEQKAALLANGDRFEVRDQAGRVILIARAELADDLLAPQGPTDSPSLCSVEELDRRVREGNWRTTDQVMERLRRLTKCS